MTHRLSVYAVGLLALVGILGCGGGGEETPGTPVLLPPRAPSNVRVTPGDGQATVTWAAPANDGGSPITGYTVRALKDGEVAASQSTPALAVTVTGLTNGTSYTFTVAAVNAQGEGLQSASPEAVTPRSIPGAPRDVIATPGDRQVRVSWMAPAEPGMPITGYTVRVLDGDTVVATQDTAGTSVDFTGLANGRAYTVTVTASNAVVAGAASAPVAFTPRSVPGAPRVTTLPAISQVNLTWTLDDDGGSPVTQYTVTVRQGGTLVSTLQTSEKAVKVLGLTNAVTYSFTVMATNAVGDGPVSEAVTAMPRTVPSQVRNVNLAPRDGGFLITCDPPQNDGGSPVIRYRATVADINHRFLGEWKTEQLPIRVTGLTNGASYTVTVQAENVAGYSNSVFVDNQIPADFPAPPTSFVAEARDGAVQISWAAPVYTGGVPLKWYRIEISPAHVETRYIAPTSLLVEGLTNGTTYTFTLVAVNIAGDSTTVQASATPTAP